METFRERPKSSDAPLLLRRAQPRSIHPVETTANMTVVTTQGRQPEMHDQVDDPTAPRND